MRVQTKVSIDFLLFTVFQYRLHHSNSFRLVLVINLQYRCCYFLCLCERSIFSLVITELQWFRDGPLERLWGEGNFRAAGIFFRYQIPCMIFFRP